MTLSWIAELDACAFGRRRARRSCGSAHAALAFRTEAPRDEWLRGLQQHEGRRGAMIARCHVPMQLEIPTTIGLSAASLPLRSPMERFGSNCARRMSGRCFLFLPTGSGSVCIWTDALWGASVRDLRVQYS